MHEMVNSKMNLIEHAGLLGDQNYRAFDEQNEKPSKQILQLFFNDASTW